MHNPILRALRIGAATLLLAGSNACDESGVTSATSNGAAQTLLSDGARFAGTNTATLELRAAGGGPQAITLSRSYFDLIMRQEKADGASQHGAQGRLFMLRDAAAASGITWRNQELLFNDRGGHRHSLRIQRAARNGPISQIKHYRDGTLLARSVRNWRSVRGGWIAAGSTFEVIRDGEVLSRVISSVRVTELATRAHTIPGIIQLFNLARVIRPAALHAQRVNRCQSQISEYADAYAEFAILISRTTVPPTFGDSFGQIDRAHQRYEAANSELQRCLIQPAI